MNALNPRVPFQILIMSEESRLGREQIETAYALKQIIDAGVRVFFYLENRERTLDSATDKFLLSAVSFAGELEREKAKQRTYDAMRRKAERGHVAGGLVYGYDNVRPLALSHRRSRSADAASRQGQRVPFGQVPRVLEAADLRKHGSPGHVGSPMVKPLESLHIRERHDPDARQPTSRAASVLRSAACAWIRNARSLRQW
jgi:hypothetical protein